MEIEKLISQELMDDPVIDHLPMLEDSNGTAIINDYWQHLEQQASDSPPRKRFKGVPLYPTQQGVGDGLQAPKDEFYSDYADFKERTQSFVSSLEWKDLIDSLCQKSDSRKIGFEGLLLMMLKTKESSFQPEVMKVWKLMAQRDPQYQKGLDQIAYDFLKRLHVQKIYLFPGLFFRLDQELQKTMCQQIIESKNGDPVDKEIFYQLLTVALEEKKGGSVISAMISEKHPPFHLINKYLTQNGPHSRFSDLDVKYSTLRQLNSLFSMDHPDWIKKGLSDGRFKNREMYQLLLYLSCFDKDLTLFNQLLELARKSYPDFQFPADQRQMECLKEVIIPFSDMPMTLEIQGKYYDIPANRALFSLRNSFFSNLKKNEIALLELEIPGIIQNSLRSDDELPQVVQLIKEFFWALQLPDVNPEQITLLHQFAQSYQFDSLEHLLRNRLKTHAEKLVPLNPHLSLFIGCEFSDKNLISLALDASSSNFSMLSIQNLLGRYPILLEIAVTKVIARKDRENYFAFLKMIQGVELNAPSLELRKAVASTLHQKELSDCVIRIGQRALFVNRQILARASSYFRSLFYKGFHESGLSEIDLSENFIGMDQGAIDLLFEILYLRSLAPWESSEELSCYFQSRFSALTLESRLFLLERLQFMLVEFPGDLQSCALRTTALGEFENAYEKAGSMFNESLQIYILKMALDHVIRNGLHWRRKEGQRLPGKVEELLEFLKKEGSHITSIENCSAGFGVSSRSSLLAILDYCPNLKELEVTSKMSAEEVKLLKRFPHLDKLALNVPNPPKESLSVVAECKNLKELILLNPIFSASQLKPLKGAEKLEQVKCHQTVCFDCPVCQKTVSELRKSFKVIY